LLETSVATYTTIILCLGFIGTAVSSCPYLIIHSLDIPSLFLNELL